MPRKQAEAPHGEGAEMYLDLVKSSVAEGAINTARPLTRSLERSKEGLAVDASSNSDTPYDAPDGPQSAEEVWRPVVGHEGAYEVSDRGRVRSLVRTIRSTRFNHRSGQWETYDRTIQSRVLSVGRGKATYPAVVLPGRRARVHVLVCEAFLGPRPDGLVTRHLNGNPYDNRVDNLTYGTVSENARDCVEHGGHYWANLTHCKRGHAFTEDNVRWSHDGKSRECRACYRLRKPPKLRALKTHCKRGHEFTPENSILDLPRRGRTCRRCVYDNQNRKRRQARAA